MRAAWEGAPVCVEDICEGFGSLAISLEGKDFGNYFLIRREST